MDPDDIYLENRGELMEAAISEAVSSTIQAKAADPLLAVAMASVRVPGPAHNTRSGSACHQGRSPREQANGAQQINSGRSTEMLLKSDCVAINSKKSTTSALQSCWK